MCGGQVSAVESSKRTLLWKIYSIAASDLGWVVGHSYIAYGPLLYGNQTCRDFVVDFTRD
jgi:acyl-coenzyme A synthetase/AMP-(fatty) acid ligase